MESDSSPAIKPIKWANVALRFAKTPNPSQQYQYLTSAEPVLLFKSGLRKCSEAQTVTEQAAISQWFAWSLPTQRSREAVIALAGTFREVSAESRITDTGILVGSDRADARRLGHSFNMVEL